MDMITCHDYHPLSLNGAVPLFGDLDSHRHHILGIFACHPVIKESHAICGLKLPVDGRLASLSEQCICF